MTYYDNENWRAVRGLFAWVALITAAVAFGDWQDSGSAGLFVFAIVVWFRWG